MVPSDRVSKEWHALLTDGRSAALLYQEDHHTVEQQVVLRALNYSGVSFRTSMFVFVSTICTTDDLDLLLANVRAVLQVFVLCSITTSNFQWISDRRTPQLSHELESLSRTSFEKSQARPVVRSPTIARHCYRAATHSKLISSIEQRRANIIEIILDLAETIPLDAPMVLYDHGLPYHQQNASAVVKKLKPSGYYWVAMAFSLAVAPVDENSVAAKV